MAKRLIDQTTPEEFVALIEESGREVQRRGDYWVVQCPCHADGRPSLKVARGDKVGLVVNCYAGCDPKDILAWASEAKRGGGEAPEAPGSATPAPSSPTVLTLGAYAAYLEVTVEHLEGLGLVDSERGVAFTFGDPDDPRGVKTRTGGQAKYIWERGKAEMFPLWPTPEPDLPQRVWITEGESDAIVARHLGHHAFAITSGSSAQHLHAQHYNALRARGAREIVICGDADTPGRKWARRQVDLVASVGLVPLLLDLTPMQAVDPFIEEQGPTDIHEAYTLALELPEPTPVGTGYAETYEEFLKYADEEVDWLIEGLIAPGDKVAIVAPQKSLKTYLVLHLLYALACGQPPLGREDLAVSRSVKCLLVEEEGNKVLFARRLKRLERGCPTWVPTSPLAIRFRQGMRLDDDAVDELAAYITREGIGLVVLDPFQRMSTGLDENSSTEQALVWDAVHRLASETGAAVIIVHHSRKDAGLDFNSIRGSSRFGGEVDCGIFLRKEEEGIIAMSIEGRDISAGTGVGDATEVKYEFDTLTDSFTIEATGMTIPTVKVSGKTGEANKANVLAILTTQPGGWFTLKEMQDQTGMGPDTLRKHLGTLVGEQLVEKENVVAGKASRYRAA